MREKFKAVYATHPTLERTISGNDPMPGFNIRIYVKWDPSNTMYYPTKVVDIEYNDVTFELEYHLEFETNDDFSAVPADMQKWKDVRTLDRSMQDWSYRNPNPPGAANAATWPHVQAQLESAFAGHARRTEVDELQ